MNLAERESFVSFLLGQCMEAQRFVSTRVMSVYNKVVHMPYLTQA